MYLLNLSFQGRLEFRFIIPLTYINNIIHSLSVCVLSTFLSISVSSISISISLSFCLCVPLTLSLSLPASTSVFLLLSLLLSQISPQIALTCSEVNDEIKKKHCIRDAIEDDPAHAQIIIEERYGHRKNDEVGDEEDEHEQIPVKPETHRK